jgi:hypothetical protein
VKQKGKTHYDWKFTNFDNDCKKVLFTNKQKSAFYKHLNLQMIQLTTHFLCALNLYNATHSSATHSPAATCSSAATRSSGTTRSSAATHSSAATTRSSVATCSSSATHSSVATCSSAATCFAAATHTQPFKYNTRIYNF